jgi:hypothetical protein
MRLQSHEHGMAILVRRPSVGPGCKCLPFFATCLDVELSTQAIETAAQNLGIEMCRSLALDVSTRPIERHQKLNVAVIDRVATRPFPQKLNDRGFPINEGPVDVEGDSVKI